MELKFCETERLNLYSLSDKYKSFILELLNTEGWIQFIGYRNVKSLDDASLYIQKILDNSQVTYWVVELKEKGIPIGIITWIKRDYLEYPDIGFAFLPAYGKNGYALEAASAVLDSMRKAGQTKKVNAITVPENTNSTRLLVKLGFGFEGKFIHDEEELDLYTLL